MKKTKNIKLISDEFAEISVQQKEEAQKIIEKWQTHFSELTEIGKEISSNEYLIRKGLTFSCNLKTSNLKNSTKMVVDISCILPKNIKHI